jgi:hypothetical protein
VSSQFGRHCLPNLGVGLIELPIAPKLTLLGPADAMAHKPGRQLGQELLAVLSPVGAAQFVFDDVAADEPVAKREAEIDGASGLGGEVAVNGANGENEVLEGQAGGLHGGFGSFLGHASV